ncbi:hypothetical protein [Paenibacillus phocaensis]|uniref:hypothetical protein n=1 Tax=Paenibacillus phocaensis TaxID=1776378 RepID=UPI001E31C611|nr:hypothetical protein [Paenibacillus phocaensis]
MIDHLNEQDQNTAYDFLRYLIDRSENKMGWDEISRLEPDNEPLSDEELRQLKALTEFVSGEEAKREFGLQVDLP